MDKLHVAVIDHSCHATSEHAKATTVSLQDDANNLHLIRSMMAVLIA